MPKSRIGSVNRRGFLKGAAASAAAGAAALVTSAESAGARGEGASAGQSGAGGGSGSPAPGPVQIERDAGNVRPPATVRVVRRPGSDLQTQVLRDLGVEYVAANPGSSFEGLQESIINYGDAPNRMPEFITALRRGVRR